MGDKRNKKRKKLSALARRKIGKENMNRASKISKSPATSTHIDSNLNDTANNLQYSIQSTSNKSFTPLHPVDLNVFTSSRANKSNEDVEALNEGNSLDTAITNVETLNIDANNSNEEVEVLKDGNSLDTAIINEETLNTDNGSSDMNDFFVVEGNSESENFEPVYGRRVIDINYFLAELQEKAHHNGLFDCRHSYFQLVGETKIGLLSKFKFECKVCREVAIINSENTNDTENVNVNIAATTGIVSSGIGYSQFHEIFSAMNIPVFSGKYYVKLQDQVYEKWEKVAVASMEAAAEREKKAAINEGRVKNGVPLVDVYVDGCWCQRSYGSNFKALSGAAVIIGKRFGEVLYLGVKNKYCTVCARAEKKNFAPKEHQCYKNYTGTSSSMESEIILEGFKSSLEMYGIAYARVIADGDASTYSKIVNADPYKSVGISVEKIECRNHILRNFCKKLRAIAKETKYDLKYRKTLKDSRIMSMRKAIVNSIIHNHNKSDAPKDMRTTILYNDILNSVAHAYGDHKLCQNYNCQKDHNENNEMGSIQNTTFLFRINAIVATTAAKSRSLLENVDTNTVERMNSVIAKFVGGKRINFSQRRGYQARCSAAVVSFNNESAISSVQKSFLRKSPKGKIKEYEKIKSLKRKFNREHPVKKLRKIQAHNTVQHDYGQRSSAPDMDKEQMEKAKENFINNLKALDRDAVEKSTILQRDSSEWLEIRKHLLTASNFGPICKRNPEIDTSPLVKNILYKKNLANITSVAHGIEKEKQALQQMQEQEGISIQPCGLFIDEEYPFIGASPDGLIGEDGVIEIKCPITAYKTGLNTAVLQNKIQILKYSKKTLSYSINTKSNWYYQVQGQLRVTRRKYCLFGIWAGPNEPVHVTRIDKNEEFWKVEMMPKLVRFYMECLLPEILDPRHARGMQIRKVNLKEDPIQNVEPCRSTHESSDGPTSSETGTINQVCMEEETNADAYDLIEEPLEAISRSRIYDFDEL